ncbi:class I SAM-dependent methyltransferase, partial [Francisella tularensis]|uniref:class I SAM-dependent methyltransferase n=1 Tax=Francisella tularensis TaxID=263 RepID=UPI001F299858
MKKENIDIISKQFGNSANDYLLSKDHSTGNDLEKLANFLDSQSKIINQSIDIGCGAGHISYILSRYSEQVYAFDLLAEMLEVVKNEAHNRQLKNIEIKQGNIESIPFNDNSFDLAISRFSAHHWDDVLKGIKEVYRILKDSGEAIFIDVIAPNDAKQDTWLQTIEYLRDPSHVRDYSKKEWESFLKEANFNILETSSFKLRLNLDTVSYILLTLPTIRLVDDSAVDVASTNNRGDIKQEVIQ